MAEHNFLIFNREDEGEDCHEDVWDDTALIQAYDRAVNRAKEKVASQLSLEDENPKRTTSDVSDEKQSESPSKSSKTRDWMIGEDVRAVNLAKEKVASQLSLENKNPKSTTSNVSDEEQSESPSISSKKRDWMIGEDVRAVYSEDGLEYEAIIKKIDKKNSSCLISFLGYGNDEIVFLRDLKPTAGVTARKKQVIASGNYRNYSSSSSSDMEEEYEELLPPLKPPPMAGLDWQPAKPEPPLMAGLDWQPAKLEPPPKFPGMSNMSSIPPPPPPTAWPTHGTAEMDSDSLYSMLMSWYMAGYHTGYYQGVQQRNKRKANSSGSS
ncbi:hypothetical protein OUZ56_004843 [Daphnia magna]|uniref:Tudor domain-containing protein n=2 Tax=Daphnia magna TaxID=35525 RepID=A0ABQ9YR26_9CRUS|nr:hypothetical protein OUZ56_004843 [Daphnia magna]